VAREWADVANHPPTYQVTTGIIAGVGRSGDLTFVVKHPSIGMTGVNAAELAHISRRFLPLLVTLTPEEALALARWILATFSDPEPPQ
jgi:hypothetical protein